MRKWIGIAMGLALLAASAGCRAQVPPNPTVYTCPTATGLAYTPLNQSSAATGLTYTDANPAAGQYCYIAQSTLASTGQISGPSNIAGPFDVTTGKSVDLTWNAPTTGPAPSGYILSRAAATASTLGAPALGTGSVAENVMPLEPSSGAKTLALAAPRGLRAR